MCFNYSIVNFQEYLEKRFQAEFENNSLKFKPSFLVSAFTMSYAPVICNDDPGKIKMLKWGLVPFWVKDAVSAKKIAQSTFNARNDTIFEKPSFKNAIVKKRCIIPADGFFEWHEHDGAKYPFYIRFKNRQTFAFAGIWEEWTDPANDLKLKTFSIITAEANSLLKKIHNVKMRMPVILGKDNEKKWLGGISKEETVKMMAPYEDFGMEAYTVSKMLLQKNVNTDSDEIIKEFKYENLKNI